MGTLPAKFEVFHFFRFLILFIYFILNLCNCISLTKEKISGVLLLNWTGLDAGLNGGPFEKMKRPKPILKAPNCLDLLCNFSCSSAREKLFMEEIGAMGETLPVKKRSSLKTNNSFNNYSVWKQKVYFIFFQFLSSIV